MTRSDSASPTSFGDVVKTLLEVGVKGRRSCFSQSHPSRLNCCYPHKQNNRVPFKDTIQHTCQGPQEGWVTSVTLTPVRYTMLLDVLYSSESVSVICLAII